MTEELSPAAKIAVWFAGLVIRTPLDAVAVWLFWRWFAVPLGAPSITFWQAMGIDLFAGLFAILVLPNPVKNDLKSMPDVVWPLAKVVVIPFAILAGFIVHLIIRG